MKNRILITGAGVLSPLGITVEDYWTALKGGVNGIRPIQLFDTTAYTVKDGGEVYDFEPDKYFSKRERFYFDRATMLLLQAARQALDHARFFIDAENTFQTGVSIGTTFGSLRSLSEFDKISVTEGPRYVNPSLFPNTVPNLPSSQISIHYKIKGFNTTLSTGMCASLDALHFASNAISLHGRKAVLSGAVEEMCEQTFIGLHRLNALSGVHPGEKTISCPFDKERNGIVFSEGAGIVVLEPYEHAMTRKAETLGEIGSISSNFCTNRFNKFESSGSGMLEAMTVAIEQAGLKPEDIDCIFANANSSKDADLIEASAILKVFGKKRKDVPVTSIKSMIGESYSAAGIMSVIAALGALKYNFIPPTINLNECDDPIDLNISRHPLEKEITTVMVNAFGQNGANSCVIIKKVKVP